MKPCKTYESTQEVFQWKKPANFPIHENTHDRSKAVRASVAVTRARHHRDASFGLSDRPGSWFSGKVTPQETPTLLTIDTTRPGQCACLFLGLRIISRFSGSLGYPERAAVALDPFHRRMIPQRIQYGA